MARQAGQRETEEDHEGYTASNSDNNFEPKFKSSSRAHVVNWADLENST
jgi:hypothetical protein